MEISSSLAATQLATGKFLLTCQQEAGDGHSIQLLGGGDVVLVHEVVQQVDGQVPG